MYVYIESSHHAPFQTMYHDDTTTFLEPQLKQYGSHMVMTNVNKSSRNKFINIDTRFANDYNVVRDYKSTSQYTFTLPEKITSVKSMRIKSVEIPFSFYNISTAMGNNTFTITSSTNITRVISLPDGNYTLDSLQNAINAQLNAVFGNVLSLVLDTTNSQFFSFVNSSPSISFNFTFNTDTSGNADKYNFRSKLGWLLGFRLPTLSVSVNSTVLAAAMPDIHPLRYLYLVVDEFSSGFTNSFVAPISSYLMNKKIIAKIIVDSQIHPFGTILIGNEFTGTLTSDIRLYNGCVDIQKFHVELVNEWGVPVPLNGLDFSFTIMVVHE